MTLPSIDLSEEELLDDEQTAVILNIAVPTLRRWRQLGTGPAYFKIGKKPHTTRKLIADYIKTTLREPVNARPAGRAIA